MVLRSILKTAAISAAMLAAASCSPDTKAAVAEAGAASDGVAEKVSENTYVNKKFGVTVTAPDGWFVMDNALTEKLMDVGKEVTLADADARTKALAESSLNRTSNIFGIFEYAPGTPVDDNAGIMALAEDISIMPGIERGSDYFFHARKMLEQTNAAFEVVGDYHSRDIDGRQFDRMDLIVDMMGVKVSQRYFAARHGQSIVVFIQTYRTEADLPALDKVIDGIKLDW